jgi:hypothetical protein
MSMDFAMADAYRVQQYEIVSNAENAVTLKVFCSLASGVYYTKGSVEIVDNCLHLSCDTRADDEIAFELVPWEITFVITYEGELGLDIIFFNDNESQKPSILRPLRQGN